MLFRTSVFLGLALAEATFRVKVGATTPASALRARAAAAANGPARSAVLCPRCEPALLLSQMGLNGHERPFR